MRPRHSPSTPCACRRTRDSAMEMPRFKNRKASLMKTVFLSLLTCVGAVLCLRADPVIQFDDLSSSLTQVPSGYHQLKYTNVFLMNGNTYPFNPSGFQA